MELKKSVTGKIVMPLYYTAAITGCIILSVIIFCNVGIMAGLAFSLVVGIAIGIAGGELEYRDHVNEIYNQHIYTRARCSNTEAKKIKRGVFF
jgi:hypothetical protein